MNEAEHPGMRASGRVPMLWAQSLYVVGNLLTEGHVAIGELDPVNRRLSSLQKPETIVQVVILAQNKSVQDVLANADLEVKTVADVAPVEVHPGAGHLFYQRCSWFPSHPCFVLLQPVYFLSSFPTWARTKNSASVVEETAILGSS